MDNRFTNVADLVDKNDNHGRTFREVNNATQHSFKVDDLVELENGVRLFVFELSRDCDGTPLYTIGTCTRDYFIMPRLSYGHAEDGMKLIKSGGE